MNDAGIPLPENWSPAAETTVATHIEEMEDDLQDEPNTGVNIAFHDGNHAMLVGVNDDGTVDVAHTSSNPGQSEALSYNSVQAFEDSVQAFEDDWSPYGDLQYVPVGTPAAPQQTGGKND